MLVEDGSTDSSLALCKEILTSYSKSKLYTHPENVNLGAGVSRNLGILKASSEYIAFLDADDWYLPNRFEFEKELLTSDDSIDGIYGATGFYFQNRQKLDLATLTTVPVTVGYKDLFGYLVSLKGRFTTDAITIKRDFLIKTVMFNTKLRLHQDTYLWYIIAFHGKIIGGNINQAVAVRRVHDENRITGMNSQSRSFLHYEVFHYFKNYTTIEKKTMKIILNRFIFNNDLHLLNKALRAFKIITENPKFIKLYL